MDPPVTVAAVALGAEEERTPFAQFWTRQIRIARTEAHRAFWRQLARVGREL